MSAIRSYTTRRYTQCYLFQVGKLFLPGRGGGGRTCSPLGWLSLGKSVDAKNTHCARTHSGQSRASPWSHEPLALRGGAAGRWSAKGGGEAGPPHHHVARERQTWASEFRQRSAIRPSRACALLRRVAGQGQNHQAHPETGEALNGRGKNIRYTVSRR